MQLSARDATILAGAAGVASLVGVSYLIQRELRRWRLLSAHMSQVLLPAHATMHGYLALTMFSFITLCLLFHFAQPPVNCDPIFGVAAISAGQ